MIAGLVFFVAANFIHEAGHAAAATVLRHPWQPAIARWHGIPVGPAIRMLQPQPRDHAIIAIAGPLANVLSGIAAWQICPQFTVFTLLIAAGSLIPAKGSDSWHFRNAARSILCSSETGSAAVEVA